MINQENLEKLIAALAAGQSVREAAQAVEVNPRTVQRRLATPAFKARVQGARAAGMAIATGELLAGMNEASEVLMSLLRHTDARIQQRAAVKLIELALKLNEVNEIEQRVEELERYVGFHNLGQQG